MSLNILILHNIDGFSEARRSAAVHVVALERHRPWHNYTYHQITWPVTEALRNCPWHVVIMDSTALGLCTVRPRELFENYKKEWSFLSKLPCLRIVFPQDDADHGALLDEWFDELDVDAVFTVRPEMKEFIYPRTSRKAAFISTFSGYIENGEIDRAQVFARPFDARSIDIGQRVTMYPPHGGRQARLKGEVALAMKAAARARGLKEDISVNPERVFSGEDWLRFLGNCKFVVGAEGGLGIWDPHGEIQDRTAAFIATHPAATFMEIEAACFAGLDGNPNFPGFSPRILEAAMMRCCQVLVEGGYRGTLQPLEHYIPLKRDFSNLREVFRLMSDRKLVDRLVERCWNDLIASDKFKYSTFANEVFGFVDGALEKQAAKAADAFDFTAFDISHKQQLVDAQLARSASEGFSGGALFARVATKIAGRDAKSYLRHPQNAENAAKFEWHHLYHSLNANDLTHQLTSLRTQAEQQQRQLNAELQAERARVGELESAQARLSSEIAALRAELPALRALADQIRALRASVVKRDEVKATLIAERVFRPILRVGRGGAGLIARIWRSKRWPP